jgi:2,3-bisphosphoglycerate-independent phosphoglycerate mutase
VSYPSVCLVVLDGWGLAEPGPGNAISLADTPVFDELWETHPHTTLTTDGPAVGLPEGQMGNSEVGHLNLGAGAVVKQDLLRIDEAVEDGSFFENETLRAACDTERLHLLGLVSRGGVHSSMDHLRALIELAGREGVEDVVIHAFTDGRDTAPTSGADYLAEVEAWGGARVATVDGRYYAMDRDRRWDRTKRAYDAIVHGCADHRADSGEAAVRAAYERDETDEFIEPTLVGEEGRIRDGDSVLFFNFRPDRARQLTRALGEPDFDEFDRGEARSVRLTTLTEYQEDWDYPVAFPQERPSVTLASTLADRGVAQLHVAETEKYAHVTYFFNGGIETPFKGEDRRLVPSQKVATYDLAPEMSAPGITDVLCSAIASKEHDFLLCNYANADMVGHTGNVPAVIKAVETVDRCLARVLAAAEQTGTRLLITADHGNCEMMIDPATGGPHTAHTTSPVPFLVVDGDGDQQLREGGALRDVGPTILRMLGLERPAEMDGRDLRLA